LVIYGNCTVVVEAPSILVYRDEAAVKNLSTPPQVQEEDC
jgi:hypothetical protein